MYIIHLIGIGVYLQSLNRYIQGTFKVHSRYIQGTFINVVVTSYLKSRNEFKPTYECRILRFYFKETPKMLISKFKQVQ